MMGMAVAVTVAVTVTVIVIMALQCGHWRMTHGGGGGCVDAAPRACPVLILSLLPCTLTLHRTLYRTLPCTHPTTQLDREPPIEIPDDFGYSVESLLIPSHYNGMVESVMIPHGTPNAHGSAWTRLYALTA